MSTPDIQLQHEYGTFLHEGGERDDPDVPPAGRHGGIAALRGGGHTGVGRLGLFVVAGSSPWFRPAPIDSTPETTR